MLLRHLTMGVHYLALLASLLTCIAGDSWSYSDSYFIRGGTLLPAVVLKQLVSRSAVECFTQCVLGCTGAAYRDGECNLIDATAAVPSFVPGTGGVDDYQVIVVTSRSKSDCRSLYDSGLTTDGVYAISPDGNATFDAQCDMSNGGWTVIQRRVDLVEDFYRGWEDYVAGFGDVTGSHWLGLEKIHVLTTSGPHEMKVDAYGTSSTATSHYGSFSVGAASTAYQLSISGYISSTGGDRMQYFNGYGFTTYDNDNDGWGCCTCPPSYGYGGWWFGNCGNPRINDRSNPSWHQSLTGSTMRVRSLG